MIRSQRQSTSRPRGLHTELDFSFNVWGVSFFLESDNPLNLEPFVVTVQLNQNLKLSDTVPCVWLSFEIAKNTNQTTIPRRPCEYYPTVTCHCKSLWEEQSWAGTTKMTWAKTITENLCMRIINYMCIHIFVHTYLALPPPIGRMVRPPPVARTRWGGRHASLGLCGAGVGLKFYLHFFEILYLCI